MTTIKFTPFGDLNQNNLSWPVFEQYDDFTPACQVDTVLPSLGNELWSATIRFNSPMAKCPPTPNDDILAGRIVRFPSLESLIDDLDKPE